MVRIAATGMVVLLLTACSTPSLLSPGAAADPWSGDYRLHWLSSTPAVMRALPAQQVQIRAITADMQVPGAQSGQDGPQWAISFVSEAGAPLPLTPLEAKDYESIRLSSSATNAQIECLESGSLIFICRTQPHTTVQFGKSVGDRLTTTTGLLGVISHQGGFELTPLDRK